MKPVELKLISELMKNSRRSDRELAKAIGISQPTVSRLIKKLEKQGIVKEYTMIPDFSKLDYEIMALTFLRYERSPGKEEALTLREGGRGLEEKSASAALMIMNGLGLNSDRVIMSFHRNYSSLHRLQEAMRNLSSRHISYVDTFIVSTRDKAHERELTFKAFGKQLLSQEENTRK